jgi:hypothetical protein
LAKPLRLAFQLKGTKMTSELTMAYGICDPDPSIEWSAHPECCFRSECFINAETFRQFEETVAELIVNRCDKNSRWSLRDLGNILTNACELLEIPTDGLSLTQTKELLITTLQVAKQIVPAHLRVSLR